VSAASDGRNRRKFPRVPVRGEVSGRIHTVASAPVLDLSEGGALLEVPCALRPRSLYSLRLSLGEGRVLTLQSSVVRSYVHSFEAVGDGENRVQYRAAIQFLNLSDADRELLRVRLYGSPEAVEGEAGAASHDHSPEELLADLLAVEPGEGIAVVPLDGLSALLEESEPAAVRPVPPAAATASLPPLPDVEPLPPLPEVAPWPSTPAVTPVEAAPPVRTTEERTAPAPEAPPETVAEEAAAAPEAAASSAPTETPARATVEPLPEAPKVEVVPRQPTPHPSAWQRIKGWISSRPAADRARGSSILGLGLEPPAATAEKPPVEERRDSARVAVEGGVSGEMGLALQSDIEALSVGGLMARMPFAPQNGSELSFTIEIDGRPIVVGGAVRNVQEVHGDSGGVEYKVGLEFGPLDDEVRAILADYVDRRLQGSAADDRPLD
jgi:hypothetical protein